jgi:hypothetical protein
VVLNSDSFAQPINDRTFVSAEPEVTNRRRASTNLRTTVFVEEGVNISELLFICVDTPSTGDDRYYDTFKQRGGSENEGAAGKSGEGLDHESGAGYRDGPGYLGGPG